VAAAVRKAVEEERARGKAEAKKAAADADAAVSG
jgi:hypothetical protein